MNQKLKCQKRRRRRSVAEIKSAKKNWCFSYLGRHFKCPLRDQAWTIYLLHEVPKTNRCRGEGNYFQYLAPQISLHFSSDFWPSSMEKMERKRKKRWGEGQSFVVSPSPCIPFVIHCTLLSPCSNPPCPAWLVPVQKRSYVRFPFQAHQNKVDLVPLPTKLAYLSLL